MFESYKNVSELQDRYSDRNVFLYLLDFSKCEEFKDNLEIQHVLWMHKNQSIKKSDLKRFIKECKLIEKALPEGQEKNSFQQRIEIFEKLSK